ncbi:MAG: hypothetical protein AB9891_09495 [Anaerolineaceae bacterium]
MLATLLIWIYTLTLLFLYGLAAIHLSKRLLKINSTKSLHPVVYIFTGTMVLTTLTSFLSLVMRIQIEAVLFSLAGAILIAILLDKEIKTQLTGMAAALKGLHPLVWTVFILALFTTLEVATHKAANSDTGLYHAQAIRWIETYPVVPGLGNLHTRLAYNSSWFVLSALFSFPFLKILSFHLTGSVLFVASLAYFASGLSDLLKKDFRLSVLMKTALLPLSFYILASEVSSTGTDLPITLLTWLIMILWMELIEAKKAAQPDGDGMLLKTVMLFLLVIFTLTVKLTSGPLIILSLVWLAGWLREKRFSLILWLAGISVLILVPWLVRNVIVSGYVAFPQTLVDLFQVDWKIPRQVVIDEAEWITSWARYPRLPKEVVLAMPVWKWAATWFSDTTNNRRVILVIIASAPFVLGLINLAGLALFPARTKEVIRRWKEYLPAAGFSYLGVLFWFFTVPGFRFGIGFLIYTLLLVLIAYASFFFRLLRHFIRIIPPAAAAVIILYLGLTLYQSVDRPTMGQRWILPMDYVNLPTAPCSYLGFSVYCATQYQQCGYEPFPCSPAGIPYVEMRGSSYEDGFRVTDRPVN